MVVSTALLRAATVLAAVVIATLAAGPAAPAQPPTATAPAPSSAPPQGEPEEATTYGFDELCNTVHDILTQVPVLGFGGGDTAAAVCKAGNIATHPGSAVEATEQALWDSAFGEATDALLTGLGDALLWSLQWGALLPNDRILTSPSGEQTALWTRVEDYTHQLQVWLLAISIAISAVRIGIARAHMAAEHAEEAFKTMARAATASWVAGAAILAGARLTDSFAVWLINDAAGGNADSAVDLLVNTERFAVLSPGLVFMVAIVGILGAMAMAVLTIIRQALLVVAVGIYPLAAAASGTTTGRQSLQKLTAWIIAFLLFKPVAALVYMIAFITADQTDLDAETASGAGESAHRALVGIVLLCSVAFVLPALLRLVTPSLSVIGSGGSGAAAAGVAAGAAIGGGLGLKAMAARGGLAGMAGAVAPAPGGAPRSTGTPPAALPGGPRPALGPGNSGGGGGGSPALPGGSGRGGSVARQPAGAASAQAPGTTRTGKAAGAAAQATGAGRALDRAGEDAAGADATGAASHRPGHGPFDIPR